MYIFPTSILRAKLVNKHYYFIFINIFLCLQLPSLSELLAKEGIYSSKAIHHPIVAKNGMVSSQDKLASEEGLKVLEEGGNAIDAAVTMGFVEAVTLPRAGNIGGGGFMLVYLSKEKKSFALDYREKAPLKATKDMYLDSKGDVTDRSKFGYLAIGVPGTVDGLLTALKKWGTISRERALAPAIKLAEEGFEVNQDLYRSLEYSQERLAKYPASKAIFFKGEKILQVGDKLIQHDLAKSLKLISKYGRDAFYKGVIAKKIASDIQSNGGILSLQDLKQYRSRIRKPIYGNYRGYQVVSMPPPSSGGTHLIQILNIIEDYPLKQWGHNTSKSIHMISEAMKIAYFDRAKYLGDPDFVKVPVKGLTSKAYAKKQRKRIDADKILELKINDKLENPFAYESNETTHYSVIDKHGNAVSNTYTLNFTYGTGIVAKGTGIFLNNEMDDFSSKPGVPNAFGLVGNEANKIQPEKRMLSSMTPTIVLSNGSPFLVTGSPGGSRIITTTLQIILNVIDYEMNVSEASHAVRFHQQWLPKEIRYEKGLNQDVITSLQQLGHNLSLKRTMGSTQSLQWVDGFIYGATDPRTTDGIALGF